MEQIKLSFNSAQHIGKREEQQDAFLICDGADHGEHSPLLFLVADGMGGMQYGKEAAELALVTVAQHLPSQNTENSAFQDLENAALSANEKVYRMASENGCGGEAGTTLIASSLHGKTLHWVSVGDSRIYLFRNRVLQQLNVEHNLRNRLASLAAKGLFPIDDIETNPQKEALTSFIGIETLKELDGENRELLLEPGDHVLLCTDGLFKTLSAKEIIAILSGNEPDKFASNLVASAINRDAPHQDNVTVVHLWYDGKSTSLSQSRSEIATEKRRRRGSSEKVHKEKNPMPPVRSTAYGKGKAFLWMALAAALGSCLAGFRIFFAAR